jgi:hypothetical protein
MVVRYAMKKIILYQRVRVFSNLRGRNPHFFISSFTPVITDHLSCGRKMFVKSQASEGYP